MNHTDDTTQRKANLIQFVKYCMVGVLNTIVCLGVIFTCKSLLGINPYISNAAGYIAGVTNSFLWNRKWVFNSEGHILHEALKFILGFGICYTLQFAAVWAITQSAFGAREFEIWVFTISGYGIATLIGNVIYTIANYLYNRLIAFR